MAQATWSFYVDTLRTGTYGASIDNLTGRVLRVSWNSGMSESYMEFAEPSRLRVEVDNRDGAFNSDSTGSELVANGSFATWSGDNPSSWTVSGESGSDPEVSQVAPDELNGGVGTGAANFYSTSATVSIAQTILTVGQSYRLTFDITATNEGTGWIGFYSGSDLISPRYHLAGSYEVFFTATGTSFSIQGSGAVNMTIDNVSVRQTGLYGKVLAKGTLGRLRANFNSTDYTLYIGRLTAKRIIPGNIERRVAVLEFTDPMLDLLDTDYVPELLTNVRTDQAIQPVFDKVSLPFPYAGSYWMLGVQGASELGNTTTLYNTAAYALDTGQTTLEFVGDNIFQGRQGTDTQTFLRNLIEAEISGRFFYNPRTAAFTFHQRHRDALNTTIAATITDTDFEANASTFVDEEDVVNMSTITYQPRKAAAAGLVLWESDNVPAGLNPGQTMKFTARYRDPANESARIGGYNFIPPLAGTDYAANVTNPFADVTSNIIVSVEWGGMSAVVSVTNRGMTYCTLTTLQLRGTPLYSYDSRSVTASNPDSARVTKYTSERINVPLISNDNLAQSYADYRVSKFGQAIARFEVIGFIANKSSARMVNALSLKEGDRISVSDSFTSHDADYIIVGTRHQVTFGEEHTHEAAFILKPQSREVFWVLGVSGFSELGQTTRLTV